MELEEKIQRAANKVMTKFQGGLEIKNLDSVEAIEAEIKILQSKLEFYKELERTKTPVEEAYKKVFGYYPVTDVGDAYWEYFQNGYKQAQKDYKVGEYQETVEEPEEKEVKKESWMDKPVEELVKVLEKNPPEFLRFQLSSSLEDRIYKWWNTCFVQHPEWSMEECVEDLLDIIELFLPHSQSHEGTQRIETIIAVDTHNELLQKIKSKLRNKK